MRIAVVGGGPLGRFLCLHLLWGGAQVTMISRRRAAIADDGFETVVSQAMPWGRLRETKLPVSSSIPPHSVVVLAVRADNLTEPLLQQLDAAQPTTLLVFTPVMGRALARLKARLPLAHVAMPALAAEIRDSTLRYWQVPWTLIEFDQRDATDARLKPVIGCFRRGRVWVRARPDVARRTVATTTAFFPLHLAIHACPNIRAWLREPQLMNDLAVATRATRRLARCLGPVEAGVAGLAWWMSSARRIRWACALLPRMAPRLTAFLEQHFGAKLGAQHVVLGSEIVGLAHAWGQELAFPASLVRSLPAPIRPAMVPG